MLMLMLMAFVLGGLGASPLHAAETGATPKYRVVWQVTADTPEKWAAMMLNVENFRASVGEADSEVVVVAHGNGIGMVMTSNAAQAERIASLAKSGVKFLACENTLKRKKIAKEQILPGVGFVDSGVAEVIRLQIAGYAYIKSGE